MWVYRSVEVKTAARDKTLWKQIDGGYKDVMLMKGLGTAHSGSGVTWEFIELFRDKIQHWVKQRWLDEGTIWTGPMQLMKGAPTSGGARVGNTNYYVHPPPKWVDGEGLRVIDGAAIADDDGILYTRSMLDIGNHYYLK